MSLFEWCLNYKKTVYFSIADTSNIYNVKVEYAANCSRGRYNDGDYDCCLNIILSNIDNEPLEYNCFVVNHIRSINDVADSFRIIYIMNPNLDNHFKRWK